MYIEMPATMRNRITSLLNTNNFTAAKALYDLWHMQQTVKSDFHVATQVKPTNKRAQPVHCS